MGLERLKHSCLLDAERARTLLGYTPRDSMGFGEMARREMARYGQARGGG